MATTTGTFTFFDAGKGKIFGGAVSLDSPDLRVALFKSSVTAVLDAATNEFLSDLVPASHECDTGGYTRYTLTDEAKTEPTAGTFMLDSSDPTWTASGTILVARYWVLYDYNVSDSAASLIAYGLLDQADADVQTSVGNTLTINVNVNGWFRAS